MPAGFKPLSRRKKLDILEKGEYLIIGQEGVGEIVREKQKYNAAMYRHFHKTGKKRFHMFTEIHTNEVKVLRLS